MIHILISDDHSLFRKSLRNIIESQHDMTVVGEAENGLVAVKQAKRHRPDIILMDVNMPEMDGIDATRMINSRFSDIKVIALSSYSDEVYLDKMMAAGAVDYISKLCSRKDLLGAIRSATVAAAPPPGTTP